MSALYILTVDCADRPGLVAAVSTCLFESGCNIEDASQFNDKFSDRFYMRVVFLSADIEKFRQAFDSIATQNEMIWTVNSQDKKTRALILVSKADHCLHDILYRVRTNHLPLDIAAVAGNHEICRELTEQRGLNFHYMNGDKTAQENEVRALMKSTGAELIILARYMQILSPALCADFSGRIINIHHSFLPGFKGADPYKQAWERGVKIIGATAHFVTSDLDEGPIIEQQTTRIDHAMTPETMRVLGRDMEAQVLSRALQFYAERRVFLRGDRTVIL